MAYRRRLLSGLHTVCLANRFRTMSWGPFTVPIRIVHVRFATSHNVDNDNNIGLFITADPGTPEAAIVNPFRPPSGWRPLHEADTSGNTNSGEDEGDQTPFGVHNSEQFVIYDLGLIVTGVPFYLKALFRNGTASSFTMDVKIVIEEVPDADPAAGVEPRPIPTTGGTPSPTPEPTVPPPTTAPPPTTPPPTLPPVPTGALPPPGALPAFNIDPRDPMESSRVVAIP